MVANECFVDRHSHKNCPLKWVRLKFWERSKMFRHGDQKDIGLVGGRILQEEATAAHSPFCFVIINMLVLQLQLTQSHLWINRTKIFFGQILKCTTSSLSHLKESVKTHTAGWEGVWCTLTQSSSSHMALKLLPSYRKVTVHVWSRGQSIHHPTSAHHPDTAGRYRIHHF